VGIGTSSPSQALEIAGSVRIDNGASFVAYEVYRDNILYGSVGGASNQFTLQASNSKSINLFDDSGVGLTVKDGGSVGIGTPDRLLTLQGDNSYMWMKDAGGGDVAFIGGDGSNDGFLRLYNGSHTAKVEIQSDGNTYFSGGNVGIGTTYVQFTKVNN
jgi:hypothetical protein